MDEYQRNVYMPSAPSYNGELTFNVEKVYPVFWPGNVVAGRYEPEMDVRIALVITATFIDNKNTITQGPIVITEVTVQNHHVFQLTIPDQHNGQLLPMTFKDDQVHIEYRLVGFDLLTNEQLRGSLPIQVMCPVMINTHNHRVLKIEKRLKVLGVTMGDIKLGIRVNNPELRPGEDLSIKLVYSGNVDRKLKRVTLKLIRRVVYNIGKAAASRTPPQKDTVVNKNIFFYSCLTDKEVKVPLSISLPHLMPSSEKKASFGNYIRVSYLVILKAVTGSYTNSWEIPIHVGTTGHPTQHANIDMDYALIRKDPVNEADNLYGIMFNALNSPWPVENATEHVPMDLTKLRTMSEEVSVQAPIITAHGEHTDEIESPIGGLMRSHVTPHSAFSVTRVPHASFSTL